MRQTLFLRADNEYFTCEECFVRLCRENEEDKGPLHHMTHPHDMTKFFLHCRFIRKYQFFSNSHDRQCVTKNETKCDRKTFGYVGFWCYFHCRSLFSFLFCEASLVTSHMLSGFCYFLGRLLYTQIRHWPYFDIYFAIFFTSSFWMFQ